MTAFARPTEPPTSTPPRRCPRLLDAVLGAAAIAFLGAAAIVFLGAAMAAVTLIPLGYPDSATLPASTR
jgi:hypothetical protein